MLSIPYSIWNTIEYFIWRTVHNQHISVVGDNSPLCCNIIPTISIELIASPSRAPRCPIKLDTITLNTAVLQVCDTGIEQKSNGNLPIVVQSLETIMIAENDQLMTMRLILHPFCE